MRGTASAIIRSGAFVLLFLSAGRSMSATIDCFLNKGALENVGECSMLSSRSLTLSVILQTHSVGPLGGGTFMVTEETDQYTWSRVHLHGIRFLNEGPPLRYQATSFGVTDLLHRLLRMFVLPQGPHNQNKRRQQ
jgi:hypothetical protein